MKKDEKAEIQLLGKEITGQQWHMEWGLTGLQEAMEEKHTNIREKKHTVGNTHLNIWFKKSVSEIQGTWLYPVKEKR